MALSKRFTEAFALAADLHRGQTRKGSEVPYLTHLMAVASLVGQFGGGEDQMIAALLHDAVEDQGGLETLATIRERFGETVADYVDGCTDSYTSPKPPWFERKRAFVTASKSASKELRLIIAADKLHNVRTMLTDFREIGNDLWGRFTADRDETLWYYAEMVNALGENWQHPILRELALAVDALHSEAKAVE